MTHPIEPSAWIAIDERHEYRYVKGLVTTNPATVEAWHEGGISYVALVPELEPRGAPVAWRWRYRRDEELGRWIYNDNDPEFSNEFIETQTLYLSPAPETCVPAQGQPDPAAQFVMWAMLEGSWQGCDIDGGAAQDKAVALGLIVQTLYDPEKHGHDAHCEPGETWFVPSETLLAALGTSTFPSTNSHSPATEGGGK